MENAGNPAPKRTGPILAAFIGCLGTVLLAVVCLIVVGGWAYLRGYSLPPIFFSATPAPTDTPLSTPTPVSSLTPTATPTFTATQTPSASASPTVTIVFPTLTPYPTRTRTPYPTATRTRTPLPTVTRTRTPTPTSTPSITTWDDNQHEFTFNTWTGIENNKALAKGMRCSFTKNEMLVFEASKNTLALSLFFYRGPDQGRVDILIDNVTVKTLDLYNPVPEYRSEWRYKFPNPKQAHQVELVVPHEKRNASTGYQVCFDGFRLNNKFTDDTDYAIRYDSWSGLGNGRALGDSYRLSGAANSSITFVTRGNSFHWVTALGPDYGQADVYVDNQFIMTVDLYSPVQQWQEALSFTNLGRGLHTVSIIVLGQHNSASSGDGVVFDGILIP